MKKSIILLVLCIALIKTIHAQVGKVGINTTSPAAMLHVKDSSIVFTGISPLPSIPGNPPISGDGARMMWYVDKAAFRVGRLPSTSGAFWNKDSIGFHSVAMGLAVKAKGSSAFAVGSLTEANGFASVAMGSQTIAAGQNSIAMGSQSIANGLNSVAIGQNAQATSPNSVSIGENTLASSFNSTALGINTIASNIGTTAIGSSTKATGLDAFSAGFSSKAIGNYSTAIGNNVTARSFVSVALGYFNDTTSISQTLWEPLDPLFIIGNGTSNASRRNAVTILKNARTGINTSTPDATFHVVNVPTNGPYNSAAVAIIESNPGAFLQLSSGNNFQAGILSGNDVATFRSGIIFTEDSSFHISTGGNNTRVRVQYDGKIGIGTLTPQRLLHVNGGTGGSLYHSNAEMILEDNDATYLQFSSPTTVESGILSGNQVSSLRSSIIFRPDSSVQIRTGGNTTRLMVAKSGNTGIGTTAPGAKLDINGTTIIGTNGTVLTEIIKVTVAKDIASIAAATSLIVDYTVANASTTSTVHISPESDLANGLIIAYARVNAAGIVRTKFTNTTGAAIDPPNMNYYITVIR